MKKIFFAITLLALTACAHSPNNYTAKNAVNDSDETQIEKEPRLTHRDFFRGER